MNGHRVIRGSGTFGLGIRWLEAALGRAIGEFEDDVLVSV